MNTWTKEKISFNILIRNKKLCRELIVIDRCKAVRYNFIESSSRVGIINDQNYRCAHSYRDLVVLCGNTLCSIPEE